MDEYIGSSLFVFPPERLWRALERAGFGPHGQAWDFRARCPVHGGDNSSSLHVVEGTDGRAVLYCFAHRCEPRRIVAAIGLSMRDLFPPGHRHGERLRRPARRRSDLVGVPKDVADVTVALDLLGLHYEVRIDVDTCAFCGSQPAQVVYTSRGLATLFCRENCNASEFVGALAARLRAGEQ